MPTCDINHLFEWWCETHTPVENVEHGALQAGILVVNCIRLHLLAVADWPQMNTGNSSRGLLRMLIPICPGCLPWQQHQLAKQPTASLPSCVLVVIVRDKAAENNELPQPQQVEQKRDMPAASCIGDAT